jgi:hypothetical protein
LKKDAFFRRREDCTVKCLKKLKQALPQVTPTLESFSQPFFLETYVCAFGLLAVLMKKEIP